MTEDDLETVTAEHMDSDAFNTCSGRKAIIVRGADRLPMNDLKIKKIPTFKGMAFPFILKQLYEYDPIIMNVRCRPDPDCKDAELVKLMSINNFLKTHKNETSLLHPMDIEMNVAGTGRRGSCKFQTSFWKNLCPAGPKPS